jgi:hypothetical protein
MFNDSFMIEELSAMWPAAFVDSVWYNLALAEFGCLDEKEREMFLGKQVPLRLARYLLISTFLFAPIFLLDFEQPSFKDKTRYQLDGL